MPEILKNIYHSLLLMVWALFTPAMDGGRKTAGKGDTRCLTIVAGTKGDIRLALSGFDSSVNLRGELRLLFPTALVITAPLLLFRLKREGFSACRAEITADGLLVSAIR